MRLKVGVSLLALVCLVPVFAQEQTLPLRSEPASGFPAHDMAYRSKYRPKPIAISPDMRVKDDAVARREWMKERLGGPVTADVRDALLSEIAAVEAVHSNIYQRGAVQPGAAGTWTNIGPVRSDWIQNGVRLTKSDTGRIRTVVADPTNPDVVYLLTSGGGLWKTTNFLSPVPEWEPKSDAVSTAGGAVALGAAPNTVLLGTGDPFDGGLGGFVVKSTDGGETWSARKPLGNATWVTDLKVVGNTVFVGSNAGLWRSDNGGETFVAAGPTATPFGVSSRNHPAFTAWSVVRANGAWLVSYQVSAFYGGIYRSVDGVNWTAVIPFTGDPVTDIGRTTLAVGEPGDPIVYAYAATLGDTTQKDLYRSENAGASFTRLELDKQKPLNPNADQPDMNIMLGQASYNQMILVDPADATRNTVYIGGQLSSARTTDGGKTWRLVSNWLALYGLPYVHADFHAAGYIPQTKAILFGTDGGLFVSTDNGRTWSDRKNDGIASYLIYALATNDKNPSDILIGLQDNGTRLRVGNGDTYNQVYGGDGFGVGWSEGWTMGSIYFSFLFRSPLGPPATQNKWFQGWNGIADEEFYTIDPKTKEKTWPNPLMTQFITNIYQPSRAAAADGRTFYHRTKYTVYRTTDSAGEWKPLGNFKLNRDATQGEFRGITHPIGVGYDNQDEIAVAMSGGRVMISTDGGATVRTESLNAPRIPGFNTFVTAVAWANQNELYLSTENPSPGAPHLVRSKDAGATWERLDGVGLDPAKQLPRVPVSRILVSTRNRNTVFVGTWIGVFWTQDGGATWAPLGAGFPMAMVNDLYMPPDGSFLRAASYGRGIWDYRF
jgi:photosystem II stability/assembly factor-like uncharacterized protein